MSNQAQFSDFDIDFTKNAFTNDVSVKKDSNSIRQSIQNIILTSPGEKPFVSAFGLGLNSLLFENLTRVDEVILRGDIEYALNRWEPRISLNSVRFDWDKIDSNEITLTINYIILGWANGGTPIHESMSISLGRVR